MALPKELIVDACILFSFFKGSSARRQVFKKLLDNGCRLLSPDFILIELSQNKKRIISFAGINEQEFEEIFSELENSIETFGKEKYERFVSKASEISPHIKDVPYFALALFSKAPIWSDEEAFINQPVVEILTTNSLDKILKESPE